LLNIDIKFISICFLEQFIENVYTGQSFYQDFIVVGRNEAAFQSALMKQPALSAASTSMADHIAVCALMLIVCQDL
jgi:hypothetical protein